LPWQRQNPLSARGGWCWNLWPQPHGAEAPPGIQEIQNAICPPRWGASSPLTSPRHKIPGWRAQVQKQSAALPVLAAPVATRWVMNINGNAVSMTANPKHAKPH